MTQQSTHLKVSQMAETMIGSEIIRIAWDINSKIKAGEKIYNLTIGDYNPSIFPIPIELKSEIIAAYQNNETNYPPADGILSLREEVSKFVFERTKLNYNVNEILIAGGSRPLIFGVYNVLIEPGEKILFPVPSWNNNHYTHLLRAEAISVETGAENNFMPTADELRPYITEASLLALCSPLNPTGTCISESSLKEICELVLAENEKRKSQGRKPLYMLYDHIYWLLSFKGNVHADPVSLIPAMQEYTVYIHGISKVFAATGVRVGWAYGPEHIISRMKSYLGHVGAWAPKAEQIATANFLRNKDAVNNFLIDINKEINIRLKTFYEGFATLKREGLPIDVIAPQAAIYLTVKIDIIGKKTMNGHLINSVKDITQYILDDAKVAIVPFYAFGSSEDSTWFRLSIGTCQISDIDPIIEAIRMSLIKLQ